MIKSMTAEEYQKLYGTAPTAIPRVSAAPKPKSNERGLLETVVKRPLERLVIEPAIRTGQAIGSAAISPFLDDAGRARMDEHLSQDTKINVPFFGEFVARRLKNGGEGIKQIIGETAETAGYLAPTGKVAGALKPTLGATGANAAAGAATGYAFDVGAKLQSGAPVDEALKPGVGTAAGALIPVIGGIIGRFPKRMEEVNLRMTPTEKSNLAKQGKDVAGWIASKKISGTPEVRYEKVNAIYDGIENQVGRVVDSSKMTFPKISIIQSLEKIPAKYVDNLDEYPGVVSKVGRMIETLKTTRGDSISASALNKMKRAEWKNAYNRQGSQVINEVSDEVGHVFKDILDRSVPGLKAINKEYGNAITARKVLFKATNRPQTGLVGKLLGTAAGAGIGGSLGGGVGAAGGAVIGEQVAAKALGTATRSRAGALVQTASDILGKIPTDKTGNLQITQKALIQLLQKSFPADIEPEAQPQVSQSSPKPTTPKYTPQQQAVIDKAKADIKKIDLSAGTPVGGVIKAAPKVGKALANIHPDDLHAMELFITQARKGVDAVTDNVFASAEKLAQRFGISMDRGLRGVANEFENVLRGKKDVPDTVVQPRDLKGRFK